MLKVNVGLSRKVSKDYNSTGFSVNLEGEITAATNDSDAVIEQVKELFDLAEEALDQQVERSRSVDAQASHDAEPHGQPTNGHNRNGNDNGNGQRHSGRPQQEVERAEPATNKQVQYLLSIGKRQRLSTVQLEQEIHDILRRSVGLYDLTKREAAQVIDTLTSTPAGSNGNGRR